MLTLNEWNHWDEDTIQQRAEVLFKAARRVWIASIRQEGFSQGSNATNDNKSDLRAALPEDGTRCEFAYGGQLYRGVIGNGQLVVEGYSAPFGTFFGASRAITRTSRNGWNDWYLDFGDGQKILADSWRKS